MNAKSLGFSFTFDTCGVKLKQFIVFALVNLSVESNFLKSVIIDFSLVLNKGLWYSYISCWSAQVFAKSFTKLEHLPVISAVGFRG